MSHWAHIELTDAEHVAERHAARRNSDAAFWLVGVRGRDTLESLRARLPKTCKDVRVSGASKGAAVPMKLCKMSSAPRLKRLVIGVDVRGWAFDSYARNIALAAPHGWEVEVCDASNLPKNLDGAGVVYNMPPGRQVQWAALANAVGSERPALVSSFNTGYPHQKQWIDSLPPISDWMIFNNLASWKQSKSYRSSYIPNGVDSDLFCPMVPIMERPRRVLWVGSQRYLELKGYPMLEQIRPALLSRGIECDFTPANSFDPPKTQLEMAEWYQTGRVYVVASETEGTPNPGLESAACGCALVSTRVGNMPELITHGVNGLLVDRTPEALLAGIIEADANCERLGNAARRSIIDDEWSWNLVARRHWHVFQMLREGWLSGPLWSNL